MIQALIFDFDGLILDTEVSSFQTWQEIYAEHNCDLPFDTWAVCIGGSAHSFDPCDFLEEQLGRPVKRDELRLRRRDAECLRPAGQRLRRRRGYHGPRTKIAAVARPQPFTSARHG